MLLSVPEYDKILTLSPARAPHPEECQHLSWLGSMVPDNAVIVEVGSFQGTSTVSIGLGAMYGNKAFTMYCVDPWLRGLGITSKLYRKPQTFVTFINNLSNFGLRSKVIPIMAFSAEAVVIWRLPIDLLFIDGKHDYKNCHYDLYKWGKYLKIGGRIAFHDYGGKFTGVTQAVDEMVKVSKWHDIHQIGSIWSAVKQV